MINNYYFRDIYSNTIAYIPLWKTNNAINMTLMHEDNIWTLETKNSNIVLNKLEKLKGIHKFLFFAGDVFALIALTLFFSWGMFFGAGILSQFVLFMSVTAILYIATYKLGLNKGLFFIGMFLNLLVTVFLVFKTYGIDGVFTTFSFYCALWVVLAIVVPKLIEKYELYKNPEDQIMWFSLDSNQGLMMFCYKSDQISEEKAFKLRKQRGFGENTKGKQNKKGKRQYDEDDE